MIRGFYSAASCLTSQQNNMNTIANNIANVTTTGFKPQQTSFSTLLYENINGEDNPISCGHGVKVSNNNIDFTQGDLRSTDMEFDCAILGKGFFGIENRTDGSVSYTRDGSFHIDASTKKNYLVNSNGDYVLNPKGKKIELKEIKADENTIATSKTWDFDSEDLGIYSFTNQYGLEMIGGNQFKATDISGKAKIMEESAVQIGYLESSAVEIANEMAKMIESSKSFSFGSKVIQAADELAKTVNQLR